jgi:membrane protein DedA with SNARE-associated domain
VTHLPLALGISSGLSPTMTYLLLVALVFAESAGVPLPGETALIAASILASRGHVDLPIVIVCAVVASVTGDNLGYWVGRRYGRRLLQHHRLPFEEHRAKVIAKGDEFFAKHGGKAVALGRFVTGVRVVVALLAGVNGLPWRVFAVWNVLGAILWATTVGVLAFYVGQAIEHDLLYGGLIAGGIVLLLVGIHVVAHRRRR